MNLILFTSSAVLIYSLLSGILKFLAWNNTGSPASEAMFYDSISDLLFSFFNFWLVRFSYLPPNQKYTFGYFKLEALSGFLQAFFLFSLGFKTIFSSWQIFNEENYIGEAESGIIFLGLSFILNISMIILQRYATKKTGSILLHTNCVHFESDIIMNFGAILSLVFFVIFETQKIEAFTGLVSGIYLIVHGSKILLRCFFVLMDKQMPLDIVNKIEFIISVDKDILKIKDLRVRSAGNKIFVQGKLFFPEFFTLQECSAKINKIEENLKLNFFQLDTLFQPLPSDKEKNVA